MNHGSMPPTLANTLPRPGVALRVGPLGAPADDHRRVLDGPDGAWLVSDRAVNAPLRLSDANPCAKVVMLAPPDGQFANVLGVGPGQSELFSDGLLVAGLTPGEWLALASGSGARLAEQLRQLAGPDLLLVDRSSGLAAFRLSGESAATVLCGLDDHHLAGFDLHDGSVLTATLSTVRCIVVRDDLLPEQVGAGPHPMAAEAALLTSFLVLCDRSLARELHARLLEAGAFEGIEAEGHGGYRTYHHEV
ncbi:MAG: hypothetical protein ACKV2O_08770 [Acidimicrobiales bacterium]